MRMSVRATVRLTLSLPPLRLDPSYAPASSLDFSPNTQTDVTIGLNLERLRWLVCRSHATQEHHENDPKTFRYAYISMACLRP